jgi:hypothetical protein
VGYTTMLSRLEALLDDSDAIAREQQEGFAQVRGATTSKRELRRSMTMGHLNHLTRVGRAAAAVEPEIGPLFVFTAAKGSHLAFRAAASAIAAAAAEHRELLVQYGLSESVLEDLGRTLARFVSAMEQDEAGRRKHVGATRRLVEVADRIVEVVDGMNGINRLRFAADARLLSEWESASNVAHPRPGEEEEPETPPLPGGEASRQAAGGGSAI